MAKRFTDTNKYKKPFTRGLQGAYKLLWDYLYHDCDHAGIWIVDFDIAQMYIGLDMKVNKVDALKYFNDGEVRVIEFAEGKKWFIKPFIEFQYGDLNPKNRVHQSVIKSLSKENLYDNNKGYTSPLQGVKDKDKDKEYYNDNGEKISKEQWYSNQVWSSQQDMEYIQMQLKINKQYVGNLLKEFVGHCEYGETKHPSYTEFKSHFVNWLRIKQSKGELTNGRHDPDTDFA